MNCHAVDNAFVGAFYGCISDESQAATGFNVEGSDGVGVAETRVEVIAVHCQPDAIGSSGIGVGAARTAGHRQRADGDANDVTESRFGCKYTLLVSAVEDGDPVHSEIATAAAVLSGLHLLLEDGHSVRPYSKETDPGQKRKSQIIVGNYVLRSCEANPAHSEQKHEQKKEKGSRKPLHGASVNHAMKALSKKK